MRSEGSAFLDRSGRVIAVDDAFRSCLGLATGDATVALRARADADPALHALLSGDGDDTARVQLAGGAGEVELVRRACAEGTFLVARQIGGLGGPALEHAMHSLALARIASGVAHDVKNPLNAMALQLALLGDKIAGAGEELASACANNLASLKNQIGRVNEVVRRLADVSDPAPGTAIDVGALAADVASLFGHDARRRGVALTCEASPGSVVAKGDPGRAARVVVGLVWRGLSRPESGGRLLLRAAHADARALLVLQHAPVDDPALAWIADVAAATLREMGGELATERGTDFDRLELRLQRETAP